MTSAVKTTLIFVSIAVALAASACGGGSDSGAETAASGASAPSAATAVAAAPRSPVPTPSGSFRSFGITFPTATPKPTATEAPIPTVAPTDEVAAEMKRTSHVDLTITVGTKVTWTNEDPVGHTSTSGATVGLTDIWDSRPMAPGDSFSFTFTEVGTFPYFCLFHPTTMTATITVLPEGSAIARPTSVPPYADAYTGDGDRHSDSDAS